VSLAAAHDPDARSSDREANLRKAVRLMTLVPETVAAWQRIRTGHAPVEAPGAESHAAYFLELLAGRAPAPEVARVLDVVLTLHADHELNASTFAARVAVATLADLHAAVVAAVATLKGPRHGGANEDVLAMLLEIGDPARAEAFVERRLAARAALSKQARGDPQARVPGFGHRVYKVDDARARVLRGMAKSMAEATGRQRLFEVAERVVDAVRARTTLPTGSTVPGPRTSARRLVPSRHAKSSKGASTAPTEPPPGSGCAGGAGARTAIRRGASRGGSRPPSRRRRSRARATPSVRRWRARARGTAPRRGGIPRCCRRRRPRPARASARADGDSRGSL